MAFAARNLSLRTPLLALAAGLLMLSCAGGRPMAAETGPTARQALEGAVAAGDWLVRTQRDDGEFAYVYDPAADAFSQQDYSFVRHAGVTWGLLDLYRRTGRQAYLRSAERGLSRLERQVRRQGDLAYVVSQDSAPLGGAALAAVAYLSLPNPTPQQRDTAAALGATILKMQRADGSFPSHYAGDASLRAAQMRSLYYPGEALLALTRLYAATRDERWLDAARFAARYLAGRRDLDWGLTQPPDDHWYVIAAAELAPLLRERASQAQVGEGAELEGDLRNFGDYAFKVADVLLAESRRLERSSPAATAGEGLAAACRLADALGRPREPYLSGLRDCARFLLTLQFSDTGAARLPDARNAAGAFPDSASDPWTRMDFQQHGIMCLLGLEALTREG
jgi:hypothetical protein